MCILEYFVWDEGRYRMINLKVASGCVKLEYFVWDEGRYRMINLKVASGCVHIRVLCVG